MVSVSVSVAVAAGGWGALGEAVEVAEGLDGVPFGREDGGRRGVTDSVEVAVGGELVDAATEGEEAKVGFEAALEAGE